MGCTPSELRKWVDVMYKKLSLIRRRAKDKFGEVNAIVTLEITPEGYKKRKETGQIYYAPHHPHFHCFGEFEQLEFIRGEWIKDVECTPINQKLVEVSFDKVKKSILEVVKYSLKPIIPLNQNKSVNLKAVDDLITAMKGKRRLVAWVVFYDKDKEVKRIESASIEDLDLIKQPFSDIPVKDVGEPIPLLTAEGVVVSSVPSFVKCIEWAFNDKTTNYEYVDPDTGKVYELLNWKKQPEPVKLVFYVGKDLFKKINNYEAV